jgi:predicted HD superfamily hydrolase involved in NAD metabolism
VSPGVAYVRAAKRVRAELGQAHRYAHVVRVARFAERLAFAHGEDPGRARFAGLFHDLARLYSNERLLAQCRSRGMPIDAFELENPIVLHARLGAELARERFGIDDEAILSAIRKHTVGAPVMSRLDIIIYLADALEPGRAYADRDAYARIALHDLDAAMRHVLGSTVVYLQSRGLTVASQTLAAQDFFAQRADASVSEENLEPLGLA